MVRDDIIGNIRRNLEEEGITFYSSLDLTDSIQDGYDEVIVLTQCRECVATISFVSSLVYYNLKELIGDYVRPFAIFNNNINDWMEARSLDFFEATRLDWELASGESRYFCPLDFKDVAFFPRLETATGDMQIFYKATANKLGPTDVPQIPNRNIRVLEFYSTSDLLEQNEEFSKAEKWRELYYNEVKELQHFVNSRSFPDRILQLRQVYPEARISR